MNRAEHLQWAKDRALEYSDKGDLANAYVSFRSDMNKHPETENHSALSLGYGLLMTGKLDSPAKMRKFIEGFN